MLTGKPKRLGEGGEHVPTPLRISQTPHVTARYGTLTYDLSGGPPTASVVAWSLSCKVTLLANHKYDVRLRFSTSVPKHVAFRGVAHFSQ